MLQAIISSILNRFFILHTRERAHTHRQTHTHSRIIHTNNTKTNDLPFAIWDWICKHQMDILCVCIYMCSKLGAEFDTMRKANFKS